MTRAALTVLAAVGFALVAVVAMDAAVAWVIAAPEPERVP